MTSVEKTYSGGSRIPQREQPEGCANLLSVADPPGPVKMNHQEDGRLRRLHRFHVSDPHTGARSATDYLLFANILHENKRI